MVVDRHAGRGERRADLDAFDVTAAEEHDRHAAGVVDERALEARAARERLDRAPPAPGRAPTPAGASAPIRSASCRRRARSIERAGRRRARSSSAAPSRCRSRCCRSPLPLPFVCARRSSTPPRPSTRLVEVERHRRHVGVRQPRDLAGHRLRGLVVQDAVPGAVELALGQQHAHLGVAAAQLVRDRHRPPTA